MKRIFVVILTLGIVSYGYSQSAAYRGGNYTGVYGVFSNPANIASNARNWDVNLLSVSSMVANDKVELGLDDFGDIKEQLFNDKGQQLSGLVNVDVIGPSFFFKLNPKHSVALTTRARFFGNVGSLDTKFAEAIKDANGIKNLPYKLSTGNQKLTLNGWSEVGASWGGLILEKERHSLKAGVTLKYLRGVGNTFANVQNLNGTIDADVSGYEVAPYLTNASGSLYLVNSGVDLLDDGEATDFTGSNGSGVGFDLGITYEYKEKVDSVSSNWCEKCHNKGYKFKAGISLLDAGSIKYKTIDGSAFHYSLNVPQGQKFYLDKLDGSIEDVQKSLDKSPYATKQEIADDYRPSLPTTLNFMLDYYWGRHFFTELSGQLSLVDEDKKVENSYCYNGVTFTPRFEGRYFGVYLPMNYNTISEFNAGITLRLGPLMIGSGSVISTLLSENKQADVFVGLRFGI